MTIGEHLARPSGHAFISYVHEDSGRVDRLVEMLEDAGVKVWRDKDDIAPGQDWRIEIKRAITEGALVFIACFSSNSEQREKTYQNEELLLAAEQIRLRPLGRTWYIPIRFDTCSPPEYDIGAGRTLRSIQHLDLFDDVWDRSSRRLLATVVKSLSSSGPAQEVTVAPLSANDSEPPLARARSIMLDPTRRLELEDIFDDAVEDLREKLSNSQMFPSTFDGSTTAEWARFISKQAHLYIETVRPLARLLVMGCASGAEQHEPLWARCVQNIANARKDQAGATALIQLRSLPLIYVVYAACVAAMIRSDFGVFRAVTLDAKYTNNYNERHPLIGAIHTLAPFESSSTIASVVAGESCGKTLDDDELERILSGRAGKRYTPVSDYMHDELRALFTRSVPDDSDYSEMFDSTEVYLGFIADYEALRVKESNKYSYMHGAWYGSFTWRNRHSYGEAIESRIGRQILDPDREWAGRKSGLLSGSPEKVEEAVKQFIEGAQRARSQRW